jgi:Uma2 family endonuclease
MALPDYDLHRWTRQDYERMADAGFFDPDAKVELIEGVVYDMSPQSGAHTAGVHLIADAIRPIFSGCYLRIQSPLALGDRSEPEPDLAVVEGGPRDYRQAHPTTALLVVEVADQSLLHDRKRKLPTYSAAGIQEAWSLNLRERALEVYRDPQSGGYRSRAVLRSGDQVSPVARPDVSLAIADLLP